MLFCGGVAGRVRGRVADDDRRRAAGWGTGGRLAGELTARVVRGQRAGVPATGWRATGGRTTSRRAAGTGKRPSAAGGRAVPGRGGGRASGRCGVGKAVYHSPWVAADDRSGWWTAGRTDHALSGGGGNDEPCGRRAGQQSDDGADTYL
ncbi:uncharacterized protein A4U43_C04F15270 [Asparagus officinalis]|uniref:Uncharacterized protein n=1 Tax=Asparagus officinalis TaxID=4686 RepID=A0A5P1F6E4_ASPOF|nr:uncharacterized protein A4U43_C04F15270 [Asparagus officinalis]